jgi:tRNA pseudouridine32 synthase/23S rRNA pseudouridine746 synthase/23S rRNA pseudouridine1911/1915/1917 synthase
MADWAQLRSGRVVLEDEAVLVLAKPPGISVMGERHDTDLVRIAAAAGEELFPVHRIDKATSGAVLLARELRWHGGLTRQFADRSAGKDYLAIVRPGGLPGRGSIDLPLSTGRKNRVRVAAPRASIEAGEDDGTWTVPAEAVFGHVRSYPSVTTFATVWQDESQALLAVRPVTGRRHQIRVHLAWIGHAIAGDPLFGAAGEPRAHLHSWRLAFDAAWRDGARLRAEAVPDPGFWSPLGDQVPLGGPSALLGRSRDLAGDG